MLAAVAVFAQSTDDHKNGEFYVGYSNGQVDTGVDTGDSLGDVFRDRENFHGVNVSGVYNTSRYLGLKGDVSVTFNKNEFRDTITVGGESFTVGFDNKNTLWNFVGGVQLKDNAKEGTFKPFVHVMAGAAHARAKFNDVTCTSTLGDCDDIDLGGDSFSSTGFSGIVGGGIDFRLNNKVQIRAIQIDYNPTRLEGEWQNNIRIGAGIVF